MTYDYPLPPPPPIRTTQGDSQNADRPLKKITTTDRLILAHNLLTSLNDALEGYEASDEEAVHILTLATAAHSGVCTASFERRDITTSDDLPNDYASEMTQPCSRMDRMSGTKVGETEESGK